jgi:PhnB protein
MTEVKRAFVVFLTFSGQCRQALKHYQKCFGGELILLTLGDAPNCGSMDKRMQDVVVSATLTNNYFKLAATDLAEESGVVIGNNISILIECSSVNERDSLSSLLLERKNTGTINGDKLISVLDRFNINWILSVE